VITRVIARKSKGRCYVVATGGTRALSYNFSIQNYVNNVFTAAVFGAKTQMDPFFRP
jgi:hypothetical protein